MMVENIKVFKATDFIQKGQKGKINLESSISLFGTKKRSNGCRKVLNTEPTMREYGEH